MVNKIIMKVIGICGGSGAGKGYVCGIFAEYGIPSIDTDAVYHEMISKPSECLNELRDFFGESIISEDGSLNRRALSDIVFAEDAGEKLSELNRITHRHILNKTDLILDNYRKENKIAAIVDAPLLFESGYDKKCDAVVAVVADKDTRIKRIIKRDGIACEAAEKRIASQKSNEYLTQRADFVITNNINQPDLHKQINDILLKMDILNDISQRVNSNSSVLNGDKA